MEIFGLHEYIKDVTRRLAKLGALAVAPDYYFRKGVDLTKITDIPQLLPIVNAKPDPELLSDLDSTVAWAKAQGRQYRPSRHHRLLPRRPHGLGICRPQQRIEGRRFLLRTSGRCAEPALAEEPDATRRRNEGAGARTLWRGRYRHSRRYRRGAEGSARQGQQAREFKIYPAAPHGFHADYRASYRKEAAEDGWNSMQAWFKKYKVLG